MSKRTNRTSSRLLKAGAKRCERRSSPFYKKINYVIFSKIVKDLIDKMIRSKELPVAYSLGVLVN